MSNPTVLQDEKLCLCGHGPKGCVHRTSDSEREHARCFYSEDERTKDCETWATREVGEDKLSLCEACNVDWERWNLPFKEHEAVEIALIEFDLAYSGPEEGGTWHREGSRVEFLRIANGASVIDAIKWLTKRVRPQYSGVRIQIARKTAEGFSTYQPYS
jgi:hypothetical protein